MEYRVTNGMKVVTSQDTVSGFIHNLLNNIPNGQAAGLLELSKEVQAKFPHVDKRQSYTRVNMVLMRASNKGRFIRLVDPSGYVMIAWAKEHNVSEEEEVTKPPFDDTAEAWED